MNIRRLTTVLASGIAFYVAVVAISHGVTAKRPFWRAVFAPVPEALADLSGTRLKSKYTAGADGSRLYEPDVLHDSTLDVDCQFRMAADQKLRCLPTLAPAATASPVMYSDDKCTKPVTYLGTPTPGCDPTVPKYTFSVDLGPYCAAPDQQTPTHVYPIGPLIGPGLPPYGLNNGKCSAPQGGPEGTYLMYQLLPELAASTFAEGTAGTDP